MIVLALADAKGPKPTYTHKRTNAQTHKRTNAQTHNHSLIRVSVTSVHMNAAYPTYQMQLASGSAA